MQLVCVCVFTYSQNNNKQKNNTTFFVVISVFSFFLASSGFPLCLSCCWSVFQFLCSSCCSRCCCRKCFLRKVLCILCSFANVVKCATPLAWPQTAAACHSRLFSSLLTLSDCIGQFNYSQVASHQIQIYLHAATLEQRATLRVWERERQAGGRWGSCTAFAARITRCSKLLSYLFNEIAFLSFQFSIPFDSLVSLVVPVWLAFFLAFFSCCWCSYSAWIAHLHLDWGVMQSNDQKEYYMYVLVCVFVVVFVCVCVCIGVCLYVYWCVFWVCASLARPNPFSASLF